MVQRRASSGATGRLSEAEWLEGQSNAAKAHPALTSVPDELIVADYVRTHIRLKPLYETGMMKPNGTLATEDRMWAFLSYIAGKRGGICSYLRDTGLDSSEIEELKRRLVR